MVDAILIGGPRDGKRITVGAETRTVETVMTKPVRLEAHPPQPPWWKPIKRLRWHPPSPPPPPELIQITYQADGNHHDGARVFRPAGGWQHYRGPDVETGEGPYRGLLKALAAVHPMIRQDQGTRWVMDLGWYKHLRAMTTERADPDHDDPDKWIPDPQDQLMGIQISVTDDGGRPHLENPRYPAEP